MDDTRQAPNIGRGVLQAIFAVFLGLMITAVVGVGVYTFHANPAEATQEQIDDLYQQRAEIEGCGTKDIGGGQCRSWEQLTAAEQDQITAIDAQVTQLQETAQQQRNEWAQSTSVILIVMATALMAVSLVLGDSVTVLSNGILLGGLFTMLYGVGWGLASGNSITRFLVLVAALVVSLVLGYLKFVRGRRGVGVGPGTSTGSVAAGAAVEVEASGSGGSPAEVAELRARVSALERRLAAAAAGLGGAGDARGSAGPPGDLPAGAHSGQDDQTAQ